MLLLCFIYIFSSCMLAQNTLSTYFWVDCNWVLDFFYFFLGGSVLSGASIVQFCFCLWNLQYKCLFSSSSLKEKSRRARNPSILLKDVLWCKPFI
jgi:hypothetical protein